MEGFECREIAQVCALVTYRTVLTERQRASARDAAQFYLGKEFRRWRVRFHQGTRMV